MGPGPGDMESVPGAGGAGPLVSLVPPPSAAGTDWGRQRCREAQRRQTPWDARARGRGEGAGEGGLTKAARGGGEGGRRTSVSPCVLSSGLEAGALFALEGPPVNSLLPGRLSVAAWGGRVLGGRVGEALALGPYLVLQGLSG